MGKIADIQKILFPNEPKQWDDIWGSESQAALDALKGGTVHRVRASSFADPADVRRFRACKKRGLSDQECFKVGDNGIGCWGDDTSEGSGPACALPPEDMIEKWGSVRAAKHKKVLVSANGQQVTCILKDRMPAKHNINNGAGIDLNPDAAKALKLTPPFMVSATWSWV